MTIISCDGKRLVYVADMGSFTLYIGESIDKQMMRACAGCINIEEAEKALLECVLYLKCLCDVEEVA